MIRAKFCEITKLYGVDSIFERVEKRVGACSITNLCCVTNDLIELLQWRSRFSGSIFRKSKFD